MDKLTDFDLAVTHETTANFHPGKNWKNPLSLTSIPLVIVTILLTLLSLGNPALALRRGDRGPEVVELQKKLQSRGYYTGENNRILRLCNSCRCQKISASKRSKS